MPMKGQFPAVIQLSSLNGANGVVFNGATTFDYSGCSVSSAGDINHDGIADMIIGAYQASPAALTQAGKTYVIFGKTNWTSPIALSSLNGNNGFELDGVAAYDYSGYSVNPAGDVNNDGIQDIVIGAYDATTSTASNAGKTYVIFGKTTWTTPFSLNSVNGANGFELDGSGPTGYSGYSVSTAADINNDGIQDIVIGAYNENASTGTLAGATYVIFGKASWSSPILLSSVNGANGFELYGPVAGAHTGSTVSNAGDINHDGIQDIIIGSLYGKIYVVFGKATWTSPIVVTSLNGINGFELDGVVNDGNAWAVNTAGDINNDGISDVIIGAPQASPGGLTNAGKAYVVFGKATWTSPISLSTLNGTNGFELDGETANDGVGTSVAHAGDINYDGIQDIIIGAASNSTRSGKSYVLFGKSVWTSPIILNSLNGVNGFELHGVAANDASGSSVNKVGDINNDGVEDIIIGAPQVSSSSGQTYVVFGDSPTVLVNNSLKLSQGQRITLSSDNLAAYDLNHSNSSLLFIPSGILAGHFEAITNPGMPISNFTQQQITNRTIQFVHDGSGIAPYYNITITSSGFAFLGPQALNISFLPSLAPTISSTVSPTMSPSFLPSSAPTVSPTIFSTIVPTNSSSFVPSLNPTFSPTMIPTMVGTRLPTSMPSFAPSFLPSVLPTSTPSSSSTQVPTISPTTPFPILLQNSLTLNNGQIVTLTLANLQAIETNFNNSQLIFTINNVQQGSFYRIPANVTAFAFPQSYIQQGRIQFRHAGGNIAPAYSVIVSDGTQSTLPNPATINFQGAPSIQINPLNITQSQTITLDSQTIFVTTTSLPSQVQIQVSNLQHATITSLASGLPVSSFTLAQLQSGDIQLQQDGSPNTPSFTLTAIVPPGISSASITPSIDFSAQGILAPRLINNYLIIAESQTVTLAPLEMYALQGNNPLPDTATFYVNDIQYGYFRLSTTPNIHVSFFTQGQLRQGLVQFTHDGSSNIPYYQLSVSSNGLQSASLPAGVFFSPITKPPRLSQPFPDQTVTVGKSFSFAIVNNFIDPQGETVTLSAHGVNKTFLPQWISYNPINQRFSGTASSPGITDIEIVGTNVDDLSAQSDFVINANPDTSTSLSYLQKTIISAAVSGGVGLSFYLFKLGLKRAADRKLLDSLKQNKDEFDDNVVRPIAEAISKRVKITGFSGISENTLDEFKGAVRTLIAELEAREIEIHLEKLEPSKRDALINEIATQTKLYLKQKRSYGRALCSFLTAEATPEDIRKAAPEIAQKIVDVIEHRQSSYQVPMATIVSEEEEPDGIDLKMRH